MLPDVNYKYIRRFNREQGRESSESPSDINPMDLQTNKDNPDKDIEHDNQTGAQLTKILSSHSSIYNALTNPDLEFQPPTTPRNGLTRFPSPSHNYSHGHNQRPGSPEISKYDSRFTIDESWQSISNESVIDPKILDHQYIIDQRMLRTMSNSPFMAQGGGNGDDQTPARPSSLLSLTTDEDLEDNLNSVVVVSKTNSNTNMRKSAMVFETDEEGDADGDADDEEEGHPPLDNTLIMPQVSMSSATSSRKMTITLLSSCTLEYQIETNKLINYIREEMNNEINVIHLSLENKSVNQLNTEILKSSNLIFIVNDGSPTFTKLLFQVFKGLKIDVKGEMEDYDNDSIPKLTVINMMTVNYFINLFDLISGLKPYQIWKTPSLNHEKLLTKFKSFVELELSNSLYCTTVSKTTRPASMERSNSMYSSLITSSRPDYKRLEKRFKKDLNENSNHVDPLNLKRLSCFNAVLSIIKRITSPNKEEGDDESLFNNPTLFAVAAFSLGISIGVGLTSLGKLASSWLSGTLTEPGPELASEIKSESQMASFHDVKESIKFAVTSSVSAIVQDISGYVNDLVATLRYTSSFMVDYTKGGLVKLLAVVV